MTVRREKAERLADEELMPLIGEKNPDAFEVFYDRHGGVAYSLAYRIVGERGAAEDVTQEAFVSIWSIGRRPSRPSPRRCSGRPRRRCAGRSASCPASRRR